MTAATVLVRRQRQRRLIARRVLVRVIVYAALLPLAGFIILPFAWMLGSSFKPIGSGIRFPPEFIPRHWVWSNYPLVFKTIPFLTYMRNSLIVTGGVIVGEVISTSIVGYSFARLRYPGRDAAFVILLATMMIPFPVTMVPTFVLFNLIHWVNTYLPLIIPAWFAPPFAVFLLRQFFMTVNRELDDAAKVDGCSELRILFQILMPLSKPALTTVAIFSFTANWNDFLGPLIYLSDADKFTLALGINYLRSFRGGGDLAPQMAASLMFSAPCIILFFLAQKYFVQGIVTTGLKG
ncbi:MAG: carbohydrate ABC transporter permease [Anaerolineae bacterium]